MTPIDSQWFGVIGKWGSRLPAVESGGIRKLDAEWLRAQLTSLCGAVESERPAPAGSRAHIRALASLGDVNPGALPVLGGPVHGPLSNLLGSCIEKGIRLPCTRGPRGGKSEPYLNVTVTRHNLLPEWIRHFMALFYDEEAFGRALGHEYYPFKNRDHFAHSFFVMLMGHLVLALEVDDRALAAVTSELGIPALPSSDSRLESLLGVILRQKRQVPQGRRCPVRC